MMPITKRQFLLLPLLMVPIQKVEYPYFVIDSHTDGLNHEAHEEQEVILC
jgi:hypothetical protein